MRTYLCGVQFAMPIFYPGFDLEILGENGQWNWRFVGNGKMDSIEGNVQSKKTLELRVEGANRLSIGDDTLIVETDVETVSLPIPMVVDSSQSNRDDGLDQDKAALPTITIEGNDIIILLDDDNVKTQSRLLPLGNSKAPGLASYTKNIPESDRQSYL